MCPPTVLNHGSNLDTLRDCRCLPENSVMTASDSKDSPTLPTTSSPADSPVEPSWKPLFWTVGFLAVVIGLWEVFFDLILEGLEFIGEAIFFAVEGSEELLEDKIEEWFDLDPYHAEIVTAWSLTPLKLLLALLALRWLWRLGRRKIFPKAASFLKRQYRAVRLAWQNLSWAYKSLILLAFLGGLLVLI